MLKGVKAKHHGMSKRILSESAFKLSKNMIHLASTLKEYTPPVMKDVVTISTMTRDTANIAQIIIQQQNLIYNLTAYILQHIILRKIQSTLKKKIDFFIYSCFINEIVPLFFPQLQ